MKKPIITEHNIETNEVIEREMTDEEFLFWEKDKEKRLEAEAEAEAKAIAKAAILDRIGLTADELQTILG